MFDFIQSIILSDFLIFIVFIAMLVAVTSWAFREQEVPGYLLGWLIGIFFIVIYSSLVGDAGSDPDEEAFETAEVTLSAFAVLAPAFGGLIIGFGLLYLVRLWSGAGTRQSVLIAVMTATLVSFLFFLTTSDEYARRVIGIFALAFSIGSLSTFVFKITPSRQRSPQSSRPGTLSTQEIPEAKINDAYGQNRLESIRRFFNGER